LSASIGDLAEAVIEVPRGAFVKRDASGRIDLLSPLPCPFNYGSVPGTRSPDGEAVDALVLGPRLPRGARVRLPVVAVVSFLDGGLDDPKLVLGPSGLGEGDRIALTAFFRAYEVLKRGLSAVTGRPGPTRFLGLRR
jgi:inorganic pyrophosphatase